MADIPMTDELLYVLPPNFEKQDPNVYGYLYLTIGKVVWLSGNVPPENTKIRVKFWGDSSQGVIMRPSNARKELEFLPSLIKYEVRCPIHLFHRYLRDSAELKLYVLDSRNDKPIGYVSVNLLFYLKKKYE